MKAKLFVRGLKEPVELEVDEAQAAQALIADGTQDPKTPFSIEGVWSGKKDDMKFVVFPKKEEDHHTFSKTEPFQKSEAEEFAKEYLPFEEQAKKEGFKSYEGIYFWLESLGAVRLERETNKKGVTFLSPFVVPGKYEQAMARKARWDAYRERVAYAKQKETQELEKMAEQAAGGMSV